MIYGKILIVDDEAEVLRLLGIELCAEGYTVIKARSGGEAIAMARNLSPDLMVMDILLPDMNGAEAIKILKSDLKTKDIPVIFLTAVLKKEKEAVLFHPHLIISKYLLDGMNADKLVDLLRGMPQIKNLPIVIYSNTIMGGEREAVVKAGATDFLADTSAIKLLKKANEILRG